MHKQFRNILGFHVLLGREGGRDLVKYFFNLEAKSLCSVFSSQHGKKIKKMWCFAKGKTKAITTQQKGKKEMWCFAKGKTKAITTQQKGKRKMWCFAKGKNKNHDHPTKGKRKLASAFNGSYEKGLRNPIIKLSFLFRILTQFSYEEYNDTKHPTTQSNDLVTSPCQLWNLNAFGCSFMIKVWVYKTWLRMGLQYLYCSCTKVACTHTPCKVVLHPCHPKNIGIQRKPYALRFPIYHQLPFHGMYILDHNMHPQHWFQQQLIRLKPIDLNPNLQGWVMFWALRGFFFWVLCG